MMWPSLLAAAALGQSGPVFRDDALGLEMTLPPGAQIRRERLYTRLDIPLPSGAKAEAQIFRAAFTQERPVWQRVQFDVNAGLGRTVTRQWEETILGVPLLLTRLNFTEQGEQSTLVGLLYSASAQKLHFRLNSTQAAEGEAESVWRGILSTLRTTSGQVPEPQRPGQTPAEAVTPENTPRVQRIGPRAETGRSASLANTQSWPIQGPGQELILRAPKDWSLDQVEGAGWQLSHPKLSAPVDLVIASGLAREAHREVRRRMGASLSGYQKVTLREERGPTAAPSGVEVYVSSRTGETAEGPKAELNASGSEGLFYWLARLQNAPGDQWTADLALLRQLFDVLRIERPD
jgi:hypothetical protein